MIIKNYYKKELKGCLTKEGAALQKLSVNERKMCSTLFRTVVYNQAHRPHSSTRFSSPLPIVPPTLVTTQQ